MRTGEGALRLEPVWEHKLEPPRLGSTLQAIRRGARTPCRPYTDEQGHYAGHTQMSKDTMQAIHRGARTPCRPYTEEQGHHAGHTQSTATPCWPYTEHCDTILAICRWALLCHTMVCLSLISSGDDSCAHYFLWILPLCALLLCSMTHYDITLWHHDGAKDVHYDVTMDNDVAMNLFCYVFLCQIIILLFHQWIL